jgi:hypothetical protein
MAAELLAGQRTRAAPARAARPPRLAPAADAARQAVLRRLSAPLKHDMVVNLQAVAMLTETLSARLERNPSDTANLQASLGKLNRLARDAVAACLQVASWFDSAQDESVPLPQAMNECIGLLTTHLNFRGFRLNAELPETEFEVSRSAARNLLAAALLLLADTTGAPAELLVRADVSPDEAVITLVSFPADSSASAMPPLVDSTAVPLEWPELQALAVAESCGATRNGDEIVLRLPRARITAPLQMAPV